MKIKNNLRRIVKFLANNRHNLLSINFWRTVQRVWKARFFYLRTIPREEFIRNIRQVELRPWNLHIELTNICNSNCLFCAYQFQKRKKLIMSKDVYSKSLSDYCAMGAGELCLESCVGDPLMDPDFILRVREARSHPEITRIITTSNCINLHNIDIDEFLHSGINEIKISTGPWDERLYKLIYRNNCYSQMRANVTQLLKKNADYASPVSIKLLFRSNLSMDKTLSLKDYQEIRFLPYEVEFNTDFDTWLGTIKQSDLIKGMHIRPQAPHDKEPCYWFYDGPMIFVDGKLGLCGCRDYNADSELIVGDIRKESLQEIWRSDKVRMLREKFWKGKQPEICKTCTAYSNLDIYRSKIGSERARFTAEKLASKK